jgi:alpha-mannosidase
VKSYCMLDGCNEVNYTIRQFRDLPEVLHLSVTIDKKSVREKESIHIAFPFKLAGAMTRIGIGDTCITPEHGQLVAANRDFYPAQRWIDVSDSSHGITLSSPQCALWEVGSMIDERRLDHGEKVWKRENVSSPALFAYAMNNYWNTNYKADQPGVARFDFYLYLHDKFSLEEAKRFGYEANQPLIVIEK